MSVRFDADADRLNRSTNIPVHTNLTVAMFVQIVAQPSGDGSIWSLDSASSGDFFNLETGSGGLSLHMIDGFTVDIVVTTLALSTWYFIGVVGDNVNVTAYVGNLTASSSPTFITGTHARNATGGRTLDTFTVGGDSFADFPNCRMAGFRIWDAALTPAELQLEMQSIRPRRTANINSFYPLLDVNDKLIDFSGKGNTLTPNGGAWNTDANPPVPWGTRQRRGFLREIKTTTPPASTLGQNDIYMKGVASSRGDLQVFGVPTVPTPQNAVFLYREQSVDGDMGLRRVDINVSQATTNYHETVLETVPFSESVVARYKAIAALTETDSLTESLTSLRKGLVGLVETVTLSESLVSKFVGISILTETVSLSEALSAHTGFRAALAETVSLTEAVLAVYKAHPSLAETISLSESLSTRAALHTAIAETVTVSESLAARYRALVAAPETVSLSESLASLAALHNSLAETVSLVESLFASLHIREALSDSVGVTEALNSLYAAKPTVSDTVTLSESLAADDEDTVALAETVTLSESLTTLGVFKGALAETVPLSESLSSQMRTSAHLADTVTLSESLNAHLRLSASLSDTVTASESLATLYHSIVSSSETVDIAENLHSGGASNYVENVSESWSLTESVSPKLATHRTVSETVGLSDAVTPSAGFHPSPAETVPFSEQLGTHAVMTSHLVETVPLSEDLLSELTQKALLSETVPFVEALSSRARFLAVVPDSVDVSDAMGAAHGASFELDETVVIDESITNTVHLTVDLDETVPYSFDLFVSGTGHQFLTVSETVPYSETLSLVMSHRGLLVESVPLAEELQAVFRTGRRPVFSPEVTMEKLNAVKEVKKLMRALKGRDPIK